MCRRNIYCNVAEHPGLSCYWAAQGKTVADKKRGRVFARSTGDDSCAECCNGDRCDDPTHYDRDSCPFCLGSGTPADPTRTDLYTRAEFERDQLGQTGKDLADAARSDRPERKPDAVE